MATVNTLVPADPKCYVWCFPGSPLKVHLDLHVVQRLKDSLLSTATGACEGLLFGRVHNGAAEILDFQPASNGDLRSVIAALPNEHGKRFLMGYYRTEEEDTFQLTPKDASLAEECFRRPYQVFLMIHRNRPGSPNATFFFHDSDTRMADFAFLEFPLDPELLAIEERDRIQRSREDDIAASLENPSPAPAPAAVAGSRSKRGAPLKTAAWTCAIALVSALAILAPSIRERFAGPHPASSNRPAASSASSSAAQSASLPAIALHAKRQNGDLELNWNRESALIQTATSGVVSIRDGESTPKRQIELDSTQLRIGSLLYSPTSDQILMQLTVTTPAGTATESVMVILPKAGSPETYSVPSPKPSSVSAADRKPSPVGSVPLAKASKPFQKPSPPKATSSPAPTIPAAPALRLNPDPGTVVAPKLVSQIPVVSPPPTPTTQPQQQQQPSRPVSQPTAQQTLPAPVVVKYEPAVAISKTAPTFPPELQSMALTRKVIEVKVTIDRTGKVSRAEAIPQKNVSMFLINAAVNAARLWKFQPALRDNEPISSESVLQFVFGH